MKITFLGAAKTVTGSCYLVETRNTAFLVDCGLHQGKVHEQERNRAPWPFRMEDIDFVLMTHAHIDHSGRLPKLYADGFRGKVYATRATAELCGIMLPDSGHIQEMEGEWRERKGKRAGRAAERPLYTMQDAIDCCRLFQPIPYGEEFSPSDDLRVVFQDAGHILGSSILEIVSNEKGREWKTVFSGDLGNKGIPIMRDPTVIQGADTLILESTYGNRVHPVVGDEVERFVRILDETIARGGNVVIPSFAVGRTQEVIYELNKKEGRPGTRAAPLPLTPVYVDSPLAVSATKVFRANADCFDEEARRYIENGDNPLDFPNLHFTASAEESKALNRDPEPKIIISASGMCDAGRIKHHLKHNLWRADSTVLFVGFQAKGTLGRELVDGARRVRIFGEDVAVCARIEQIEGFSGHADRDGLLEWVDAMEKKPGEILLVHGEPEGMEAFAESIRTRFRIPVLIPEHGEAVTAGAEIAFSRVLPEKEGKERDQAIRSATRSLDELLSALAAAAEEARAGIQAASDRKEMDEALRRLRKELEERINASLLPI